MGLLELPPLPELVLEIIKAFLTKRDREFEDFLLSEKEVHQFLLEVANTPPFKRGEAPITNLRTALIVLGDTTTKILVLGLISQKLMRTSFTEFSFHKFWARALSQAIATYLFSDLIENIPPHLPLSAYLMDYGILLLYLSNPEKYLQVLSLKKQGYTLIEAEKEVFGISHPEVGAEYLENYALPRRFILNILHHHNLMEKVKGLPKEIQIDLSFLQIVDNFVGSFFSTNREERWNNFKKLVINYLKEEEIETLGEVFPKIANTYLPFFNLQEFQLKSFSELEREKEEEIKKLVSVEKEKEKEIIFPIEMLKHKLLDLQRQREALNKELQALRKYYQEFTILDEVTGLYKEEYFLKRLKEEVLRAKRYKRIFSLILIHLDKLRELGSIYGLSEEEKILKKLAKEFEKLLRRVDLVGKAKEWNNFYVLLPETPSQGAMVVARKLLRKIEEIFYKDYNLKSSAFLTVLTFDPTQMDPKKETPPQNILLLLTRGIELLRKKGQNKVLLLKLEEDLEKKS